MDSAQSQLIRAARTLTADTVGLVRAMYLRSTWDYADFLWIALAGPTDEEFEELAEVFDVPPLWVADALNPKQRAKAEFSADGQWGLILFKIVSYDKETSGVDTGQIALVLGPSFVLTVRLGPIGALTRVRAEAVAKPEFLGLGPLAAVHAILDAIVDDYLEVTDALRADIDVLEERVFSTQITDDSEAIYQLKRENLELRRALSPLLPVAHRLNRGTLNGDIPAGLRPHFQDVGDHLLRANDSIESHESLLMTMLQASNARQGLQQNTDMRKIAAYAAMLAWSTAVAGVYGMNFLYMPELDEAWGYPFALGLMFGGSFWLYRAFKHAGWL